MKVRFDRQELTEALTAVYGVTAARTPKPILRCVRLDAEADAVVLTATDQEIGLRYAVTQVEVNERGAVLVVADTLLRIVRECADEALDLQVDKSQLHVRGEGSHFRIVTQPLEDFPPVSGAVKEPDFSIDQATLRRLIDWTVFSCARESSRYAINGVLILVEDSWAKFVATDGRRLSFARGQVIRSGSQQIPQAIVPARALTLLSRLAMVPDGQVAVKVSSNQVVMSVGGVSLSSALVEGHFPDYETVVPKDCTREATLNVQEFQSALKRAALLTNEESRGVRFSFDDGTLTLSSRAPEQGDATISMPVAYRGEPLEIGFNPAFLLDVLRVAHEDEMKFAFKEANRPGVGSLGSDFVYVVMPVNLTSA